MAQVQEATERGPGRQQRKVVPRSSHGRWSLRGEGERDPVAILQAQAADRVPELVPIRYGRMLASPFSFYRGAAAIMADDFAQGPATGLQVQLCGDAHLANFGGFSAPDRALVFDVNDFDETLAGPFEWDIKRLAASFAVAGRSRGFSPAQRATIVRECALSYTAAMNEFADQTRLEVWYARLSFEEMLRRWGPGLDLAASKGMHRLVRKARGRTSERAFSRYTRIDAQGTLAPVSDPPLLVPLEELLSGEALRHAREVIGNAVASYITTLPDDRRVLVEGYRIVGFARKVVGVGSVGTRCWIILMVAKEDGLDDLVLQVKEAGPSVLEAHLGTSGYENHGRRVVEGQRLMQAASDSLLGWLRVPSLDGLMRDYYVRQMWDGKVSADLATMPRQRFGAYGCVCGWTLARAHARSGDRKAIAEYLGGGSRFAETMVAFAEAYADQNEADFAALQTAAADGRIEVAAG